MVITSKKTNQPYIAIECDGAAYHGSLEDYSWDNHRQNLLEEHGFTFHRIWSSDWWENPSRELKELVDFIRHQDQIDKGKALFDEPVADHLDLNETYFFERHEKKSESKENEKKTIERPKKLHQKDLQSEFGKDKSRVKLTLFDQPQKTKAEETVKVGKIVKIKFLDDGKEKSIKLAKNSTDVKETDEFIVISEKSPMGDAIIGKKVADTFEIGSLEKYCKVLQIN